MTNYFFNNNGVEHKVTLEIHVYSIPYTVIVKIIDRKKGRTSRKPLKRSNITITVCLPSKKVTKLIWTPSYCKKRRILYSKCRIVKNNTQNLTQFLIISEQRKDTHERQLLWCS